MKRDAGGPEAQRGCGRPARDLSQLALRDTQPLCTYAQTSQPRCDDDTTGRDQRRGGARVACAVEISFWLAMVRMTPGARSPTPSEIPKTEKATPTRARVLFH